WREVNEMRSYWSDLKVLNVGKFAADQLTHLCEGGSEAFGAAARARDSLADYGIDRREPKEQLAPLQAGLDALERVVATIDVPFISRVHRASALSVLLDYLGACRRYQDDLSDLTASISDPSEVGLSDRLREIFSICSDIGLTTLAPSKLNAALDSLEQSLE